MLYYHNLSAILQRTPPPLTEAVVVSQFAPLLVRSWLNGYGRVTPDYDAVETKDAGFSYLFDIAAQQPSAGRFSSAQIEICSSAGISARPRSVSE